MIDAEGKQLGVVPIRQALLSAEQAQLDLVEISPQAVPVVCKIMDYGKYLYEQNKKAHVAKRHQKRVLLKEMKFRPGTEEADYLIKLRKISAFLEEGHKVKVTVQFRGRELSYQDLGVELLSRIQQDVANHAKIEQHAKLEGKQLVMVISADAGGSKKS